MQKVCEVCGSEYEAHKETSRFCGPTCRSRAHRSVAQSDDGSVASGSVARSNATLSMNRKCGPIPGDPDYDGVALQEKYRDHWADPGKVQFRPDDQPPAQTVMPLPDLVPDQVKARYAKGEPEYVQTIDHLCQSDLASLQAERVFVPMWRYNAGSKPLTT
jgi:hypothetical protein